MHDDLKIPSTEILDIRTRESLVITKIVPRKLYILSDPENLKTDYTPAFIEPRRIYRSPSPLLPSKEEEISNRPLPRKKRAFTRPVSPLSFLFCSS